MERQPLTDAEVRAQLLSLPGWQLEEGRLVRELSFDSFVEAFGYNVYNRVTLKLWTHDANGITALDLHLAHAAEKLL